MGPGSGRSPWWWPSTRAGRVPQKRGASSCLDRGGEEIGVLPAARGWLSHFPSGTEVAMLLVTYLSARRSSRALRGGPGHFAVGLSGSVQGRSRWGGGISLCPLVWARTGRRRGPAARPWWARGLWAVWHGAPGTRWSGCVRAQSCSWEAPQERLSAKRRPVEATLSTMMICHLLSGLFPDAGFNLP